MDGFNESNAGLGPLVSFINTSCAGKRVDLLDEAAVKVYKDKERQAEADGAFRAADSFEGEEVGMVFKEGTRGLGYYEDLKFCGRTPYPVAAPPYKQRDTFPMDSFLKHVFQLKTLPKPGISFRAPVFIGPISGSGRGGQAGVIIDGVECCSLEITQAIAQPWYKQRGARTRAQYDAWMLDSKAYHKHLLQVHDSCKQEGRQIRIAPTFKETVLMADYKFYYLDTYGQEEWDKMHSGEQKDTLIRYWNAKGLAHSLSGELMWVQMQALNALELQVRSVRGPKGPWDCVHQPPSPKSLQRWLEHDSLPFPGPKRVRCEALF